MFDRVSLRPTTVRANRGTKSRVTLNGLLSIRTRLGSSSAGNAMVGWGCVFFFNGVGAFYWLVEEDDVGFPHAIGRQAEHVDAAVVGHVPLELIVGPSLGWNMFQVVFFLALDHGKSFKTLLWSRSSKNKNTIGINPVPICLFVFFLVSMAI